MSFFPVEAHHLRPQITNNKLVFEMHLSKIGDAEENFGGNITQCKLPAQTDWRTTLYVQNTQSL